MLEVDQGKADQRDQDICVENRAGRFYRFEHIDTYSSGKVVAKWGSIPSINSKREHLNALVLPRFRHKTSTAEDVKDRRLVVGLTSTMLSKV